MIQGIKGKRVLICEDEGYTIFAFRNALLRAGYDVVGEVNEGQAAVALAKQLQPDLILMDIHLGGSVSGIEAACQILSEQNVAIVVVTASDDDASINAALSSGACGYLVKPVFTNQLIPAIEAGLARYARVQSNMHPIHERQRNKDVRSNHQ